MKFVNAFKFIIVLVFKSQTQEQSQTIISKNNTNILMKQISHMTNQKPKNIALNKVEEKSKQRNVQKQWTVFQDEVGCFQSIVRNQLAVFIKFKNSIFKKYLKDYFTQNALNLKGINKGLNAKNMKVVCGHCQRQHQYQARCSRPCPPNMKVNVAA